MRMQLSISRSLVCTVLACSRGRLATWQRGMARRGLRRVRRLRLV